MKTDEKHMKYVPTAYGQSAQDRILTKLIHEQQKVEVFLINGVQLVGEIVSYDQFVILIRGAMTNIVFKHAISTIQPATGLRIKSKAAAGENSTHSPSVVIARKRRLLGPAE